MDLELMPCCKQCTLLRTFTTKSKREIGLLRYPSVSSRSLFAVFILSFVILLSNPVSGYGDPVYIRSSLQLLSSDTLRWFSQDTDKSPLTLNTTRNGPAVVCRVWHTSLRGVGLVSTDNICNISTPEGNQGSAKFQTLSTSASRLVWTLWERPSPPPLGAVAISFKPAKYLATDYNFTSIGYLDPTKHLGSGIFPDQPAAGSCFVLSEIEPERYELSELRLKRNKGFIEEDIVLAFGRLKYEPIMTKDKINESTGNKLVESNNGGEKRSGQEKGKVESILSYDTSSMDSWGQGYLMSKGLPTLIKLSDGSVKSIEWGIPSSTADKTETITAVAELRPGTGVNVTLHGTRVDGEMSYVATLKTIFKDGSSSSRTLEGHRRLKDIQDIRLEHSKIYFLSNDSIVPELLTTTTSSSSSSSSSTGVDSREDQYARKISLENSDELMSDQGYSSNEKIVVSASNGHGQIPNLLSGNDAHSVGSGNSRGQLGLVFGNVFFWASSALLMFV